MLRIFISYSRKDIEFVRRLAGEKMGWRRETTSDRFTAKVNLAVNPILYGVLSERDIHEGLSGSQKFNFPRCVNEAITL